MKKKKFLMVLPIFMVCIIGSGCASKQSENNLIDMTETTQQVEISIENSSNLQESSSASGTGEEPNDESTISMTESETSMTNTAIGQSTNSLEDIAETVTEIAIESDEDINNIFEVQNISGYQMVDRMNVPVNLTFELVDIKRGEEAYNILLKGKTDLEPAENGMEYILITLNISYVSGEADTVYIMENYATLEEAKMYFALSNGDSNAIQMTNYLSDSIYNLAINKGESARGTVAFLHRSDSKEPLQFIGFGKNIQFNLE